MSELEKILEKLADLEQKVKSLQEENDLLFYCLADVLQDATAQNAFIPQLLINKLGDYKDACLHWERDQRPDLYIRQLTQSQQLASALSLGFRDTLLKDAPFAKKATAVRNDIDQALALQKAR
ncbi:hypothetical protein [Ursidibacter arcticus]